MLTILILIAFAALIATAAFALIDARRWSARRRDVEAPLDMARRGGPTPTGLTVIVQKIEKRGADHDHIA